MAEILQIRLTVSQDFIGAGENTICVLEHNPVKIRSIKVGDTELTVYTIDENTITINADIDEKVVIIYDYWSGIPTIKGNDGMSAYEAAIKGGWKGSEEAFYTAITSVTSKQTEISAIGMLKGNGNGEVVKAVAGADYVIPTGSVATANALVTGRNIQTNLGSTSKVAFDGSADVTPGVTGILSVANGGTGSGSVDNEPVSGSSKMVTSGGIFEALKSKADASTVTSLSSTVTSLNTTVAGKANTTHSQAASTITAGTLGGAVTANASAVSNLNTSQVRNIKASTTDLTAGTALATGDIYIVYEA